MFSRSFVCLFDEDATLQRHLFLLRIDCHSGEMTEINDDALRANRRPCTVSARLGYERDTVLNSEFDLVLD